ncbi:IPTL-CTERM sorting domain-containing protein [Ottowia beijingensis]|uniref:IPTL-CTERM sorting domain-containing protein n=1 Tax=Ottowia beijingensis TaxID=1207057 RepID=A0A853ITK3_9BURK|nr:IPTL-CTERM sorting domain-containing protein [Ottowia beijingensis]
MAAVPTLGEWGLMMLGLLAAGVGARNLRQRR